MDTDRLDEDEVVQKAVGNVLCNIKPEDIVDEAEDIFKTVDERYGHTLRGHIHGKDLDKAHQAWNDLAEVFINMAHGQTEVEAVKKVESK